MEFTAAVSALRAKHPTFRRSRFFDGRPVLRFQPETAGEPGSRLRNIRALWAGDSALRVRTPWGGLQGAGAIHYDYTRGTGTLGMIFAVPNGQSPPVRFGDRFVLARLLVRRPPAGAGCDQPICIEWARATFALTEGYEPTVASGDRFVTWNSRAGGGCAEFRRPLGPRPWKPPPGPGSR